MIPAGAGRSIDYRESVTIATPLPARFSDKKNAQGSDFQRLAIFDCKNWSGDLYKGFLYITRSVTRRKERHFRKGDRVSSLLPAFGLFSSSEVRQILVEGGLSEPAARKALERAARSGEIWRTNNLAFAKNERLFCSEEFLRNPRFPEFFLEKLKQHRPSLERCLRALSDHEVLLLPEVQRILAAPDQPGKNSKRVPFERELSALLEFPLIKRIGENGPLDRVSSASVVGSLEEKLLARLAFGRLSTAKCLFEMLREQLERQNVIAWKFAGSPAEEKLTANFNGFPFSGHSFSWLTPMVRIQRGVKAKPTPVVFDVLAKTALLVDVEGLVERILRAGYNGRLPILGIIAARNFAPDAWNLAKKRGLWAINLEQYFGSAALNVLVQAERILAQLPVEKAQFSDDDLKSLAESIDAIKTDPVISALRSHAFEALSALILKTEGWEDVRTGVDVPLKQQHGETTRDVDVAGILNGGSKLRIVECKAEIREKTLNPIYVRRFFHETLPAALKHYSQGAEIVECEAEIWTTGRIGDDAEIAFRELKTDGRVRKQLRDYAKVMELIPKTLKSSRSLLAVISGAGLTN